MKDLLGKSFSVGDGEYRVVDVRRMNGESMVYAEATRPSLRMPRQPQRMAFHYSDIAELLSKVGSKVV